MTAASNSQLDVVIDGTWVVIPTVDDNKDIVSVDVYSPACGHPHGVYFTGQLNPTPWPDAPSFHLLDNHGYSLAIERSSGSQAGMPVKGIDQTVNHCLTPIRPLGGNWDLMFSMTIGPDAWASSDTIMPQTTDSFGNVVNCLSGKDAPTGKVSGMQTLSFKGVSAVSLCGAPANFQSLIPNPWSGNGTLIIEGDVPYSPTILHERMAFVAMSNMAGLDLSLDFELPPKNPPQKGPIKPMIHVGGDCGYTLIVLPS